MIPPDVAAVFSILGLTILRLGIPILVILALGTIARRVQMLTP